MQWFLIAMALTCSESANLRAFKEYSARPETSRGGLVRQNRTPRSRINPSRINGGGQLAPRYHHPPGHSGSSQRSSNASERLRHRPCHRGRRSLHASKVCNGAVANGAQTRTVVPAPTAESIVNVPPTRYTRSRMLTKPRPGALLDR
jgi:hypothetical protein